MHWIQKHILSQLIYQSSCRYADLKPDEVEGNLFMYHLRQLIKAKYVTKNADGRYELTPAGRAYADTLSLESMKPRIQPRIVTLIVCRNSVGEWLFLRRKRQPLLGMAGFPYGKIHLGETIAEAAARELSEKAGLTCRLEHRGDGYVTITEGGHRSSEIMFHLFYGAYPEGELKTNKPAGKVFWAPESAIDDTYMPSVKDLLRLLRANDQRFFTELTYDLKPIC